MQLLFRENLARVCKFQTNHGEIETPTVMPVINPNLNFLTERELRELGAQAVITNSYIIKRTESLSEYAMKYGVHKLINFNGPIMTDSGTFQSYVYGDIEYNNREIVDFQRKIGSDIITILDIFSKPEDNYNTSKMAVEETYKRLKEINIGKDLIAGPIQGSIYPDLRQFSAELMSEAPYLPIGGVVPLLESYRYKDLVNVIINSKLHSDFSRPVHLFGGGHPMFFAMSILLGVDIFDSASYIKYAKDNRILYQEGTRSLKDIRDFPEWSPIYGKYKPDELLREKEGVRIKELSKHNLKAIFMEINEIKERIYENTLYQYVHERAHSHPSLYKAYIEIMNNGDILPYQSLSSKSPFFFYDEISFKNPWIQRIISFTINLIKNNKRTILLTKKQWKPGMNILDSVKKLYESINGNILVPWNGIYIPIELENTYPVGQMVSSDIISRSYKENYIDKLKSVNSEVEFYNDDINYKDKIRDFDHEKIKKISCFQFGTQELFSDNDKIIKSKATGHIRNIMGENNLIATMRNDGFFTLGIEGGKILKNLKKYPELRIVVPGESGEYNAKGYNVFFKFVEDFDENIISGNDVLVVDPDDNLYAVGKATVSGRELKYYNDAVAVKVHVGIK